jgi:hypothetical protein
VLLLDNGHLLEGDITRVGDQYRVRRSVGETWVPGDKARCLCGSLEQAYAYLRGQANLDNPEERLRLARWCQLHGLRVQALAEVSAAVELRPNHAESRHLLANLQRAVAEGPPAQAARPADEPEPPSAPLPALDLSAEAVSVFNTRVQPILMNACAGCHAAGHGGSFKLVRTFESGTPQRRSVQQNLAAVLAQVNLEKPSASPLLTKGLSCHGDMIKPVFKDRQAKPYRSLEEWVQLTMAANPQLHEQASRSGLAVQPAESKSVLEPVSPREETGSPMNVPAAPTTPGQQVGTFAAATPPESRAAVEPPDEFSPAIFNRQMHPGQREKK